MAGKKCYVTKGLLEAAYKARAISKADLDFMLTAGRGARGTRRHADVCEAVRHWRETGRKLVKAPLDGETGAATAADAPCDDSSDRVAALVARRNEIGPIPPPRHGRVRESCRLDLERFGWLYCRSLLDHRASATIRDRLVRKMQEAILGGGQLAVQFTRGAGKTTWTVIALVWALLYGHRRFPVCISASAQMAKAVRKAIFALLAQSDEILADFPPVPTALRKMDNKVQKGMALTYMGRNVGFESGEVALVLPDLRDKAGKRLDEACGAVVACRGVGGSVRGLNIRGMRPDFVLFDDPQTQKDARSASAVERIDRYIHSDALNLSANTASMAAFMTITPQCADDLAMRISDRSTHPNWSVSTCPFLMKIPDGFDDAVAAFCERYSVDNANDDFSHPASREWYRKNRHLFKGTEVVDPLAFDRRTEIDAVHHALNKIAATGRAAFDAEFQMQPVRETFAFVLTDRLIRSRVRRGTPPNTPPPDAVLVAAATDINPGYALTTAVLSFDLRLTALVLAYHATKIRIPDKIPESEFDRRVFEALAMHGREIAALGVKIDRWGVDAGGRQFPAVTRFAATSAALCGMEATAMLGRAGRNWNPYVRSRIRAAINDTVLCRDNQSREWLAFDADAYKEKAQLAWTAEPGAPGGLSLFDGGADHTAFAIQVANERLVSKKRIRRPDGMDGNEYDWKTRDPHDFGDCLAMCYALAGAEGLTGDGTRAAQTANSFEGWTF